MGRSFQIWNERLSPVRRPRETTYEDGGAGISIKRRTKASNSSCMIFIAGFAIIR
jgi:hypothetical protein